MRPSVTYTRQHISQLLAEILIRVVLVVVVCAMALTLRPRVQHITQDELLTDYKRPRRQSYVPIWAMVGLIIFVPLILFALPWLLTNNDIDTTQAILAWTLALSITAMITEVIKLSVGRPRPDFFYRCFPDGKMTKGLKCVGNVRDVIEGRKSFPSGHSSFAFASLFFLSLWIYGRLRLGERGYAAKVFFCVLPVALATVIAVSRVCDNHHHWGDVLTGSVIGSVTSYFCYHYYYNPLDSELAGIPYVITESESDGSESCCTRNLSYTVGSGVCYRTVPVRLVVKLDSRENSSDTLDFV